MSAATLAAAHPVGARVMFRCDSNGNILETGTVTEHTPNGGLEIEEDVASAWHRPPHFKGKQRIYFRGHETARVKPWDGVTPPNWGESFWPTADR